MANNVGEEASSRGNEWEVVSLTASTYSAAPGPKRFDDDKGNEFIVYEEGTADAMVMSGHFVFPSNKHENPPLEPEKNEIDNEPKGEGVAANDLPMFDMNKSEKKNVEDWNVKELPVPDELTGIQFFDEKGNRLSVRDTEFEEGMGLRGLNLIGKEENIYNSAKFSSSDSEANVSGSTVYDKDAVVTESCDPSQKSSDNDSDLSKPISHTKEVKFNKYRLPCEELWKRRIASLYKNAKEANAYWSVFVAAALMGLVIIGQRWQQNKSASSAT
ncbi:ATG8-interacting protein 2-like [Macadamia integrifolia]|uniref:ATG8-interacting protein 2-like n=1 Tax=Macadamia integrifolia TaxID=60698 RepID=UPI001C501646|nr:ATG8-interacting protein 2-like [Macadamia integrifolia]